MSKNRKSLSRIVSGLVLGASATVPLAGVASATPSDTAGIKKAIEFCESGGNAKAQNPTSTASGLFQFLDTTWRSLDASAGYARAKDAPVAVQERAFDELYAQMGTSPWLASKPCWSAKAVAPNFTRSNTASSTAAQSTQRSVVSGPTIIDPASTSSLDYSKVSLTKAEKKIINDITAKQKKQTWWTAQAAAGRPVWRTVATNAPATIHDKPSFDSTSTTSTLKNADRALVIYKNTDWAQITTGVHKGKFISTDYLNRLGDVKNGQMTKAQLAEIPANLRAGIKSTNAYLNLSAAKQLVTMNAAFKAQFGYDLKVNEGYRTLATQKAYRLRLGASVAAAPGTSNHGYGVALDLATPALAVKSSAERAWMATNGPVFGFESPSDHNPKMTPEWWHFETIN